MTIFLFSVLFFLRHFLSFSSLSEQLVILKSRRRRALSFFFLTRGCPLRSVTTQPIRERREPARQRAMYTLL